MKANLENKIKEQFKNRELDVSEDAWAKLNAMLDEQAVKPKKSNYKIWIPIGIAASLLLVFGWVFMNQDSKVKELNLNLEEKIVQQKEVHDLEIQSNGIENAEKLELNQPKEIVIQKVEKAKKELKSKEIQLVESKIESKVNPEKEQIHEKIEIQEEKQIVPKTQDLVSESKSESNPKPKPNYVDAEMLLYSIENNKAVKQKNTTNNSKLVLIDFNK